MLWHSGALSGIVVCKSSVNAAELRLRVQVLKNGFKKSIKWQKLNRAALPSLEIDEETSRLINLLKGDELS